MDAALAALALSLSGLRKKSRQVLLRALSDASFVFEGRGGFAGLLRDAEDRAQLLCPGLWERAARAIEAAAKVQFRPVVGPSLAALFPGLETPPLFFVRGQLPTVIEPRLAVVGSRSASGYGLTQAKRLSEELSGAGVWIISGLARGIDAAAHRGALAAGGKTLAVLGSGPDRLYPAEHRALLDEICREGAVLTEHAPGVPPLARHFPARNRLLVGIAEAVLVVEGRQKSGTLTSVRWAADLGREVLVLPGPIDAPGSEGPIALLREGATPIGEAAHIFEALGLAAPLCAAARASPQGSAASLGASGRLESELLALLGAGALGLDALVECTVEPPGRLLSALLSLEAKGLIERRADQRFALPDR